MHKSGGKCRSLVHRFLAISCGWSYVQLLLLYPLFQPYPDIPFLMTAMSPYRASSSASSVPNRSTGGRGKLSGHGNKINTNNTHLPSSVPKTMVQRGFTDLLSVHGQISAAVPCDKGSRSTTLAAAFLVRGQVCSALLVTLLLIACFGVQHLMRSLISTDSPGRLSELRLHCPECTPIPELEP